jgi:hypothetical protein
MVFLFHVLLLFQVLSVNCMLFLWPCKILCNDIVNVVSGCYKSAIYPAAFIAKNVNKCWLNSNLLRISHVMDTLLYYSSKSASDIEKYINEDLNLISQWLDQNLLTLNCKKSKFVLFGSNSRLKSFTNISIHVNEHQLARERTFKYLGITFSENLTWSDHLNNISTKINQHIGLLRRIKTFIPLKTRLIIYNALILHYLTTETLYGVTRITPP